MIFFSAFLKRTTKLRRFGLVRKTSQWPLSYAIPNLLPLKSRPIIKVFVKPASHLTPSWRIFVMTMMSGFYSNTLPQVGLTRNEIMILDHCVKENLFHKEGTISHYLTKISRLGGYIVLLFPFVW